MSDNHGRRASAHNLFGLRGRIRLRARTAYIARRALSLIPGWRKREKLHVEFDFWRDAWDAQLRRGQFWNSDVQTLLEPLGAWPFTATDARLDYATIRELEARAHGVRILKEAQIDDTNFFNGKVVMDIGPGAVCFLEYSGAVIGIAIEPLARRFAAQGLLLSSMNTIYLPVAAENIPLLDGRIDVVVSRNNLDHVDDPARVVAEVQRVLRPGGVFILIVHLEPIASITEPHAFSATDIRALTRSFYTEREVIRQGARTDSAETLSGVYRKVGAA